LSLDEGAKRPEVQSHPEGIDVDATGRWEEGGCAIPGEICPSAVSANLVARRVKGGQKSAEGIVASVQRSEGPNMKERKGTDTLTDEKDAGRKVEIPEDSRKGRGGTSLDTGRERQASAAVKEIPQPETTMLVEEVLRRENLIKAYHKVRANKGAPGVDGMTVDDLKRYLKEQWLRIREQLLARTYIPQPVRRVDIPKPGGKGTRMLGIPTVLDRFIQQAILQVLTPIFDPHFSESSYGFRPGRNAHDAVLKARQYVEEGYRFVVDIDLERFFDTVNHDMLMARVAKRVTDKRLLKLIRRCLASGIMHEGVVQAHTEGTPQGSPLSPLLSNILLDELDKELEWRGHRFCRYADDCNTYVKSQKAGMRVMTSITRFLEKRMRLKVNREKSALGRPWVRKFLGYSMTWHKKPGLKVAPESVRRLKGHIQELLRRGRGRSVGQVIAELAPLLTGWMEYFKLAMVKNTFEQLDEWLRRKLRCILWRQWKKPRTRAKRLIERGIDQIGAYTSAYNGHGPWWNACASHMNAAVPVKWFAQQGLVSLLTKYRSLNSLS
jgi:RNA-directed DNA polymerase